LTSRKERFLWHIKVHKECHPFSIYFSVLFSSVLLSKFKLVKTQYNQSIFTLYRTVQLVVFISFFTPTSVTAPMKFHQIYLGWVIWFVNLGTWQVDPDWHHLNFFNLFSFTQIYFQLKCEAPQSNRRLLTERQRRTNVSFSWNHWNSNCLYYSNIQNQSDFCPFNYSEHSTRY
jgi:hypothetical protein